MANLVLAFGELLAAAILLDAGIKGDSITNVVNGIATQHPLASSGSTSSSGGTPTTPGTTTPGSSPAGNLGTYVNPVPGASTGRIDQGVDYTLGSKGFLAPGRSKIVAATSSDAGWGGGGIVSGQFLDGPLAGQIWYAAEGVAPTVSVGQLVNAGQQVARAVASPYNGIMGNIEAGFAEHGSPTTPLAQSLPGYGGDQSTQALTAGYAFSRFVAALGGVAGVFQGAGAALASSIEHEFATGTPSGVPY